MNEYKISVSELFYYLFWAIMLLAKGTGMYEGQSAYKLCLLLGAFFIVLKLIFTDYSILELIICLIMVGFGGYIYFHSEDISAIILVAVVIGMKNISVERLFKIGGGIWTICFIYMVVGTFFGVHTGPIMIHEKLGLGPLVRWSLGYTHPNVLHITYVILESFILYLWYGKKKKCAVLTILLMIGNIYVFLYSLSFTGFLLATGMLIINWYFTARNKISICEKGIISSILPFILLFSLVGPFIIQGKLYDIINNILNSRYHAIKIYISELGIRLFGTRVASETSYALDNSYANALLSYGIIFFAILMLIYETMIIVYIKEERRRELVIILSLLIAGISEPFLFNTSFKNLTLVFLGGFIFEFLQKYCPNKKIIKIMSNLDIQIRFKLTAVNKVIEYMKKIVINYKKKIVSAAMLIGLISMCMFVTIYKCPDSIYIKADSTDCGEMEVKFLNLEHLPDNFNSMILDYVDEDTPMYEFKGNTVTMEAVRGFVSSGLWGTLAGGFIFTIFLGIRKRL